MRPFYCPACRTWQTWGVQARGCAGCGSLERHRSFALLLPALADLVGPGICLDIAPAPCLAPAIDGLARLRVARVDFDPAADGRAVDVRASVTELPFPDGSARLVLCSHVLEHVPDDRAAMRELGRVLDDAGIALVLVPWRPGPTDEDPDAPVEERLRRFGQADHIRWYGDDFEPRLAAEGLQFRALRVQDVLPAEVIAGAGLLAWERFWLVRRAGTGPLPDAAELAAATRARTGTDVQAAGRDPAALLAGLETAADRIADLTAERAGLASDLDGLRAQLKDLRQQQKVAAKALARARASRPALARRAVRKLRRVVSPTRR
jgi:SAM-dependent methyltransferase